MIELPEQEVQRFIYGNLNRPPVLLVSIGEHSSWVASKMGYPWPQNGFALVRNHPSPRCRRRRRHHCRSCGRLFCDRCSPYRSGGLGHGGLLGDGVTVWLYHVIYVICYINMVILLISPNIPRYLLISPNIS